MRDSEIFALIAERTPQGGTGRRRPQVIKIHIHNKTMRTVPSCVALQLIESGRAHSTDAKDARAQGRCRHAPHDRDTDRDSHPKVYASATNLICGCDRQPAIKYVQVRVQPILQADTYQRTGHAPLLHKQTHSVHRPIKLQPCRRTEYK